MAPRPGAQNAVRFSDAPPGGACPLSTDSRDAPSVHNLNPLATLEPSRMDRARPPISPSEDLGRTAVRTASAKSPEQFFKEECFTVFFRTDHASHIWSPTICMSPTATKRCAVQLCGPAGPTARCQAQEACRRSRRFKNRRATGDDLLALPGAISGQLGHEQVLGK